MKLPAAWHFNGKITGNGLVRSVEFDAKVDECGRLEIDFEPLLQSIDGLTQPQIAGTALIPLKLTGLGENGEAFYTESLYIRDYSYRTGANVPTEHIYRGICSEAKFELPQAVSEEKSRIVWQVRQLQTHNGILKSTPYGVVGIAGARTAPASQILTGSIAIEAPGPVEAGWWATAEHILEHITRVLSLGCGTYLQPVVEYRIDRTTNCMRVFDRSDTSPAFLAPFRFFHLEGIVQCGCDSFPDRFKPLKALDVALRWLLVPAHYDEMKLITAMTALENILDIHFNGTASITKPSYFKRIIAKAVRQCLIELGVDGAMLEKVPELNRLSFSDKLEDYINSHAIMIADLPENWRTRLIHVRNSVAHRGINLDGASGEDADLWPHILVARELIIRIILTVVGFEGRYFGQLDINQELDFPKCQPVRI